MLVKDAAPLHASEVLEQHWGVERFPVDPIAIAQDLGLVVWRADLPFETSGYIEKSVGEAAQIYLNRTHSMRRQTFTCAHEVGHYYERLRVPEHPDEEYSFLDLRESSGDWSLHEFYADEFAGSLLMPAYKLDEMHDFGFGLRTMADYFGVSLPAITTRLRRLGLR